MRIETHWYPFGSITIDLFLRIEVSGKIKTRISSCKRKKAYYIFIFNKQKVSLKPLSRYIQAFFSRLVVCVWLVWVDNVVECLWSGFSHSFFLHISQLKISISGRRKSKVLMCLAQFTPASDTEIFDDPFSFLQDIRHHFAKFYR